MLTRELSLLRQLLPNIRRQVKVQVNMLRTIEAIIDEDGQVHLLEEVRIATPRRVLVTILEEVESLSGLDTAQLSEASLAADWSRPEEDEAWTHLQSGR